MFWFITYIFMFLFITYTHLHVFAYNMYLHVLLYNMYLHVLLYNMYLRVLLWDCHTTNQVHILIQQVFAAGCLSCCQTLEVGRCLKFPCKCPARNLAALAIEPQYSGYRTPSTIICPDLNKQHKSGFYTCSSFFLTDQAAG